MMGEENARTSRTLLRTYMGHLRNLEECLSTITSNNSKDRMNMEVEVDKINASCLYLSDNFQKVVGDEMNFERSMIFTITTLNMLMRMYAVDALNAITAGENFQWMAGLFVGRSHQICWSNLASVNLKEHATELLKSIWTNFAQDSLIEKCLKRLLTNESSLQSGPDVIKEQSSPIDINHFRHLLKGTVSCCAGLCRYINSRSADEFIRNYTSIMIVFHQFISNILTCVDNSLEYRGTKQVARATFHVLWNLTDKTPFVPLFVNANYAKVAVEWLDMPAFKNFTAGDGNPVISIIHNISRHKQGLHELRTNDALEALKKHQSYIEEANIARLKLTFGMALVTIAENEEAHKDNQDFICWVSRELYERSKNIVKSGTFDGDGYHLSELLHPLRCTLSNTFVVRHIFGELDNVEEDPIKFFAKLLTSVYGILLNQEADDRDKLVGKSLVKILLCISSDQPYRRVLIENHHFHVLVEGLARRPKQDIAKRIWANLLEDSITTDAQSQLRGERKSMIYISYNWADIEFCKSFIKELREFTKIDIWVDYENVDSFHDMWDHLQKKIDSASLIIVLMSKAYLNSINNRQELNYINKVAEQNEESIVIRITAKTMDGISDKASMELSYSNAMSALAKTIMARSKQNSVITQLPDYDTQSTVCTIT